MIYFNLLWGFLRVGMFAFGGAYGAIPLIRDIVVSYGWLTEETLAYWIAVSESTPGAIMINLATAVGCTQAGIPGALLASLAVILPSFLIILLLMPLFKRLQKSPAFQAVLSGVKPCVVGLILATGAYMIWGNCAPAVGAAPDGRALLLTVVLAAILFGWRFLRKKKMSPMLLIAIAAVLGMIVY